MKQLTFILRDINTALNDVGITVPNRPVIPICEFVSIKAKDGVARLFTSDITASTCVSVPCDGDDEDGFNISYHDLHGYIRNCKSDNVVFKVDENRVAVISNQEKAVFSITREGHLDDCCSVKGEHHLPQLDVTKLYKNIAPFTSTQELDGARTGILLDGDGEKVTAVATNNHILAIWNMPFRLKGQHVITKSFVKAMHQFWSEDMTIKIDDNQMVISNENVRFRSVAIDGKFPDYKPLYEYRKDRKYFAKFAIQPFLELTNKAMLFSDKYNSIIITFGLNNAKLTAGNKDIEKEYSALIDCENDLEENFSMGYDVTYLHRIVSLMEGDHFKILLSDPTGPTFITDQEGNLFLLMPKDIRKITDG